MAPPVSRGASDYQQWFLDLPCLPSEARPSGYLLRKELTSRSVGQWSGDDGDVRPGQELKVTLDPVTPQRRRPVLAQSRGKHCHFARLRSAHSEHVFTKEYLNLSQCLKSDFM